MTGRRAGLFEMAWDGFETKMSVRWIKTTREVYCAIYQQHHEDLFPIETLTDNDGRFGEPKMLTVWGFWEADCGLIKSVGTEPDGIGKWTKWEYFIACMRKDQDE